MKLSLSLTQRYLLFLAVVIAVFIVGSQLITSRVIRSGLVELFRQRFTRAGVVLDQYATNHRLVRTTELETVLNSPRFLAAMETGDSATIAVEMPVYQRVLGAAVMIVTDTSGNILFSSERKDTALTSQIVAYLQNQTDRVAAQYLQSSDRVLEVFSSSVANNAGAPLGWIAEGNMLAASLPEDLKRLTGCEVIVSRDSHVFGATDSPLLDTLLKQPHHVSRMLAGEQELTEFSLGADEIISTSIVNPQLPAVVTFVSSLNTHINPIRQQISLYLVLLAVIGGLLAMMAIYLFTSRRIGRQVGLLVGAVDKIAKGDLEFHLTSTSRDEFGYLASEFEKMRDRLAVGRREIELAHASALSAERLAAVGKLATGIIHDFKNPMAVIRGTVDLIRTRECQDEKLNRYCTTIHDQVDRMVDLTRDVLDYSRGESRLAIDEVNLAAYAETIKAFHHEQFHKAGITFTITGPRAMTVKLDPNRFRRVLDNILNNAREALRPGDEVEFVWAMTPERVVLTVRDTGPGIPEKIKETLFEPFVTSGKEGGTGLGLAIARKIVEDHGGSICVQSHVHRGTTFVIELPATLAVNPAPRVAVAV